MEHQQAAGHHEEHPPTTIRQYILIGVILAVITAVELALTEALDLPGGVLVGSLIFLSAIKFGIVVALFMHLRFDNPLFWRLFVFGLALAGSILIALLALFWGGHHESLTERVYATPGGVLHAEDEEHAEGEGEGGEGTPAAGGEGAATETPAAEGEGAAEGEFVVQGVPAGDFFQTNCASCHGPDRAGISGLGLPLTPTALDQPDEFYEETIANGRAGTVMPPWSGTLSAEEISTMVDFLKTVEP